MHIGIGQVHELILEGGILQARISCSRELIPRPGQYLLASTASDSPLPVPVFQTGFSPSGFLAAPILETWRAGQRLYLRGPLGHGFVLPLSARRVGLIAFDDLPLRLNGLIEIALEQNAEIALVCHTSPDDLPDVVEVHPLSALEDVVAWADYLAFDIARENLHELKRRLGERGQAPAGKEAQVLIRTPIVCGGIAECGVCAVMLESAWKFACKEGPVFKMWPLMG
ncbi:MAG TPA: hypothetical protein VNK49_10130 [Anaerolineales bacterium]|nr:hypothetical protein [Anaerolineales bacterium]